MSRSYEIFWCGDLKKLSMIFGCFSTLLSFFLVEKSFYFAHRPGTITNDSDLFLIVQNAATVCSVMFLVNFVLSVFLVLGCHKEKPHMILPWLIANAALFAITVLFIINNNEMFSEFGMSVVYLFLILEVYEWLGVLLYYESLKEKRLNHSNPPCVQIAMSQESTRSVDDNDGLPKYETLFEM